MRAPQIFREFFEWRWAPCVGLTVGSLMFVGLAVSIIPSQIEESAHPGTEGPTAFNAPAAPPNTAFASSLSQSPFATTPTMREAIRRPSPPPPANDPAPRRGFSPPIEQPAPPPPPPPPPPVQVAPPAAAPAPPMPPPDQGAPSPAPPPVPGEDPPPQQQ